MIKEEPTYIYTADNMVDGVPRHGTYNHFATLEIAKGICQLHAEAFNDRKTPLEWEDSEEGGAWAKCDEEDEYFISRHPVLTKPVLDFAEVE